MRRVIRGALALLGSATLAHSGGAQALGPQRQFLAIEPYYEHTQLDVGATVSKQSRDGYGARLWVNLDPFHFIPNGSLALFTSFAQKRTAGTTETSMLTYGAEYDQFLMRRPIGGFIDPFISVGGAAYRVHTKAGATDSHRTYGALIPGAGLRIPIPNRFELRGDVKDLMLFNQSRHTDGTSRRTNNLVVQGGLGITF